MPRLSGGCEQMRIAFIHPFLFLYARGIERYIVNLANVLAQRGVEVDLLTWRWSAPIQIDVLDPRVHVHTFPTSRYYSAQAIVPFYVWHLLTNRYDFLWISFAGYGEAEALTLARRQRFGIEFQYPYAQVPHRYREFERYGLVQRATQIVSVSRFVAQGVREALGRDSIVINNGVDTQRFVPNPAARVQVRSALNLLSDTPLLVTTAALEERKGIQWVLRALPRVIQQFPNLVYLVLGDGPYRSELEQLARDVGIANHVRFLGVKADVTPYEQSADVFLILSRGEACALSPLESLACGVPVVAARHPPFDELIEPAYGLMVDEKDPSGVSEAVVGLLKDPARRQVMGAAGRERMIAEYTWARVGEQYINLHNAVVHS
jgi:glycosyltransferase involved in cell wall biosynthesis